jgi:hypothetical protein
MEQQFLSNTMVIENLLKILIWMVGIFGFIISTAITLHFLWKRKVDDKIAVAEIFHAQILERMEQGAKTMDSHSAMFKQSNDKFLIYDRIMLDVHYKTKALIKRHNLLHHDVLEEPTIIS